MRLKLNPSHNYRRPKNWAQTLQGSDITPRINGIPILAIDESGNLGITGRLLTEDALANSATRSSESAEYRATSK